METAVRHRPVGKPLLREARERRELPTADSPPGLRVVQITANAELPACHIYMEAHVFTPDSRRFVFQKLLSSEDPGLRWVLKEYWLCDLEDDFAQRQLTDEERVSAPSVSPDGAWMYYFVSQWEAGRPGTLLKRVSLESYERETVLTLHAPLPLPEPHAGKEAWPTHLYSLSSISADGRRLCTGAFLGDGRTAGEPWGVLVCDVIDRRAWIALAGVDFLNPHPQYCQAVDPVTGEASRDIMVQHNHGGQSDARGDIVLLVRDADLHVIRDDGSGFRDVPCGRDGVEVVHGHECWRGRGETVVAGVDIVRGENAGMRPLIEARPVASDPVEGHLGKQHPDASGNRCELTRDVERPMFGHFAFDPSGKQFTGDWHAPGAPAGETTLWAGSSEDGPQGALSIRYLLHPRSTYGRSQATHPHPFLSPDARRIFFNTDFGGTPQAWMVEGH